MVDALCVFLVLLPQALSLLSTLTLLFLSAESFSLASGKKAGRVLYRWIGADIVQHLVGRLFLSQSTNSAVAGQGKRGHSGRVLAHGGSMY